MWGPLTIIGLIALSGFATDRWLAGAPGTAALAEGLRLVLYWAWCRLAWRSTFALRPRWARALRVALAAGLVTVALT